MCTDGKPVAARLPFDGVGTPLAESLRVTLSVPDPLSVAGKPIVAELMMFAVPVEMPVRSIVAALLPTVAVAVADVG